jgi:hypothetical protein
MVRLNRLKSAIGFLRRSTNNEKPVNDRIMVSKKL